MAAGHLINKVSRTLTNELHPKCCEIREKTPILHSVKQIVYFIPSLLLTLLSTPASNHQFPEKQIEPELYLLQFVAPFFCPK